ncbi:NlpC/P60 family protein [Planosporangium sp. 12N6]|uniref:C40 family peptidase n=1 Tax=Planosporangium spinosum TaxID=3402278 RepID=UPI003CFB7C39
MAPQTHRDRPRRTLRSLVAALAALAVAVVPTTHAYAEPDQSTVEAQIDKAWNDLEPLVEQYNKVHAELQANQDRAAALQRELVPLQLEVDAAMAKVSNLAVQAYKGGPTSTLNALLTTGSPAAFADQLSLLDAMAHDKRTQINGVLAARDRYTAEKKSVDDLVAQQRRQDAELAARKAQIEQHLADLQQLRQQVTTTAPHPSATKPVACPVEYSGGPGGAAAKAACGLIGKPYIWAATGPNGYDCSGLTLTAWSAAGASLRHYTSWQWQQTRPVSRADLRPGDLVFFFRDLHHVGLYVGDGWMVHAPQTGDVVRMARIDKMPVAGYRRPA